VNRLHFLTQFLQHPSAANIATLVLLGVVVLAVCYLVSRIDLAVIVVVGLFLEMFSGSWSLMGVPLPLDRLALLLALVVLVLKGARWTSSRRLVLRPVHVVLLLALTWATASALVAGTLFNSLGFYALLDRFGLVPFALFCLAPLVFGSNKQRNVLLVGLVAIGLYLSVTAVLEGLHAYKLILPHYIADPNVGIQFGRARGPLLETTGDGFCIFTGAVGAATALGSWRSWWGRAACILTMMLAGPALLLTLTRGVWIGATVGTLVAMFVHKRTRPFVVPLIVTGLLAVVVALSVSPALRSEVRTSADRQASVWDRQNTDLAALRIVEEYPLTGVGWENFINVSSEYMRQQPGYPITGLDLEVHNVFLSHAAELGVPGLLLWALGLGGAMRRALFRKRSRPLAMTGEGSDEASSMPPWWEQWRPGGLAIVLCFVVEANLAPFSEPLPNALLWIWLGILAIPYTSTLRLPMRQSAPGDQLAAREQLPVFA
jgi:O-antigen ligase